MFQDARHPAFVTPHSTWAELMPAVRAALDARWQATQAQDAASRSRRVVYLSMEFLMGRSLANALDALALRGPVAEQLRAHASRLGSN